VALLVEEGLAKQLEESSPVKILEQISVSMWKGSQDSVAKWRDPQALQHG